MIKTQNFKTKTIFMERDNERVDDKWGIALDIGYSAVKGFSNNRIFCFPAYARKVSGTQFTFGQEEPTDIQYKDGKTGEIWVVGEAAINMMSSGETRDSIESLYGRNRYYSDIFKVISSVGLGIGMLENEYDSPVGKTLVLQTGLPPAYRKSDTEYLTDVLAGDYDFSIKIGNRPWTNFSFKLPETNIAVMDQPMGTLMSIATNNDGAPTEQAMKYFSSNMLILDAGFGTLDIFNIRSRSITSTETFDDLGMKRVLAETTSDIYNQYHQEVSVPTMQKHLSTGNILYQDRKNRVSKNMPFGELLEAANKRVCLEALSKIDTLYNNLFDHDYLVVTGGTGAAWMDCINEYYHGLENLTIISGNQNDDLPFIFSNVRGYYMYLITKLKRNAN